MLINTDPIIAAKNDFTSNPLIINEVNHNENPLITKVKSPNVNILIGKVNTIKMGRKTALIIPKTTATITATIKFATSIPG